jgi:hypothetical protein
MSPTFVFGTLFINYPLHELEIALFMQRFPGTFRFDENNMVLRPYQDLKKEIVSDVVVFLRDAGREVHGSVYVAFKPPGSTEYTCCTQIQVRPGQLARCSMDPLMRKMLNELQVDVMNQFEVIRELEENDWRVD